MERYYQKEIECASREQIRAWQDERLVRQVRHVWDNVPYYRAKMEAVHVTPDDVKRLAVPVLAHRLIPRGLYGREGESNRLMEEILQAVPVPTEARQ